MAWLGECAGELVGIHPSALGCCWKASVFDVAGVGADCSFHRLADFGVALGVSGRGLKEAKDVVPDLDLAIASVSSPNPDRRNAQALGHFLRQWGWHKFKHGRKGPSLFQRHGVFNQALGATGLLGLNAHTQLMLRLRCEA